GRPQTLMKKTRTGAFRIAGRGRQTGKGRVTLNRETIGEEMQEAIVNEEGWFASTKPEPMLAFLQGRASGSKLRLFGCACCRRVWPLLTDERSRAAVEVAERYADGLADARELAAVRTAAVAATHRAAPAALAAYWATSQNPAVTVGNVCAAAAEAEARA